MVFRDSAHLRRNSTTNSVYVAMVSKVFQATSIDIKFFVKHFHTIYHFGLFVMKHYQCNCINKIYLIHCMRNEPFIAMNYTRFENYMEYR